MTLALPGPAATVVTPLFKANSMVSSIGLQPSIPRILGVIGSVTSFPSAPSKPMEEHTIPKWLWASISPGNT